MGPTVVAVGTLLLSQWWSGESGSLADDAQTALENQQFGRDADLFASAPTIDDVASVNTHRDGEPIYVPVIEIALESTEEPDRAAAYRIAAAAVRAVRPALADIHIRHYDVLFSYGETSWTGPWMKEKRRIAVTPRLLERLDREPSFDAAALRSAIEDRDDGDDEIPPVAWGEPLADSYYYDTEDWSGGVTGMGF
ncbi:hypothetical protein OB955_21175 [Halobacteria archaeon AArc-m2/3/4]|uniref:Uncharacterized protein n=1 Tax=Natronoglomus mannanivorans TaxID=2979990 RepID=A0ABT2QK00_9EURY|nr:hypothetical protein [Halobacteria archaeon AArc-m2/3/4]